MPKSLRSILLLFLLCLLWACGGDRALQSALDRAEALMEVRPDSALALLHPYDGKPIKAEEQRARFALLYSMALDKNYVDTADISVIQPALDYYPTHGTDADKLRTLYYAGVIYQNADSIGKAMEAWADALQYRGPQTDSLTLARLLVNQGNEYYRLYQFEKFIDNQRQAEEIYRAVGKKDFADKAFLNQFELWLSLDSASARKSIGKVGELALDPESENAKLARTLALQYSIYFESPDSLNNRLKSYKDYSIEKLDLAQALLHLKKIKEAEEVFDSVHQENDTKIKYLLTKTELEKAKGNFEYALHSAEETLHAFDVKQSSIIQGDQQFVEERTDWRKQVEERRSSERKAWIVCSIIFVITLISAGVLMHRSRVRTIRTAQTIASLIAEQKILKEALERPESQKFREALFRRMQILKPLTSDDEERFSRKELKKVVEERDQFMRDSRTALSTTHPKFVAELTRRGLTDEELDYVSLYAIGMNGKEVGAFLHRASHYHMSSRVRAKLGFDKNGPRLRTLILEMLEQSGDF